MIYSEMSVSCELMMNLDRWSCAHKYRKCGGVQSSIKYKYEECLEIIKWEGLVLQNDLIENFSLRKF